MTKRAKVILSYLKNWHLEKDYENIALHKLINELERELNKRRKKRRIYANY